MYVCMYIYIYIYIQSAEKAGPKTLSIQARPRTADVLTPVSHPIFQTRLHTSRRSREASVVCGHGPSSFTRPCAHSELHK